MIVDIDRLPAAGLKICKNFEFYPDDLVDENAVFLEPVTAEARVKKIGEEVLIKGKISTTLSLICSRCLSSYEFHVDVPFDLVFFPEEAALEKDQLDQDDMDMLFYNEQKFDLKEVILEQLNLSFPVKPLCSQSCQGICPVCGKIARKGECSCLRHDSDPRLQKFKIFIRDKE
jgi:uncharacterized protein